MSCGIKHEFDLLEVFLDVRTLTECLLGWLKQPSYSGV